LLLELAPLVILELSALENHKTAQYVTLEGIHSLELLHAPNVPRERIVTQQASLHAAHVHLEHMLQALDLRHVSSVKWVEQYPHLVNRSVRNAVLVITLQ
jgi:hypothetical protein